MVAWNDFRVTEHREQQATIEDAELLETQLELTAALQAMASQAPPGDQLADAARQVGDAGGDRFAAAVVVLRGLLAQTAAVEHAFKTAAGFDEAVATATELLTGRLELRDAEPLLVQHALFAEPERARVLAAFGGEASAFASVCQLISRAGQA